MSYGVEDIKSLSAGRAFREKLGMYLCGDKQKAINLGLRELVVNVQDEYEVYQPANPYCKLTLDSKTGIIRCEDNARGIPVGKRSDGINSLTAAFLIPHSGGKHTEGAYSSAVGINGEGNKIVCHTAEWLEVEVHRDGNIYKQRFESDDEGAHPTSDVQIIGKANDTGTIITYKPDPKIYGDIFIDIESFEAMLKNMSLFSKGLSFIFIVDGKEKTFYSKNGLIDGLSKDNVMFRPFSYFYETPDCKVEFALQWVTKKGNLRGYANSLYVPNGGKFMSQFKSSLTRTFNSLAKSKFEGEQIRNLLDGFVSVKVKVGQWSNQQKDSLENPEAGTATSAAISACLKEFQMARPDDFNKVVELLTKLDKADRAAERERQKVLNAGKEIEKETKKKSVMVDKLLDCRNHDENSIIYICEGDSALGSFTNSRDSEYVAAIPVRGKVINALKNALDEVLENQEVQDIAKALGCGILDKVNIKKLRYGKVAIAADADPDGFDIVCLLLVLFYVLMPEVIIAGKLYWAQFPLYEVTIGKELVFAYDDEELEQIVAKHPGAVYTRNKGLGEMDPDVFALAAYGENARLIQFTIEDAEEAARILNILLGKENEERTDYIFSHVDFSMVDGE